jgi:proteasome lid subunit RPN8/RPN11
MTVHRLNPLSTGPASGKLLIAEGVLAPTQAALESSSGNHRRHEGLVLWLGRTIDTTTIAMACAAPPKHSGPGRVHLKESNVGAVARCARSRGLGVVAQVHSHPGCDTRHSDGDDELILMPFEGMFSLVVADFGRGSLQPEQGAGLHQYQNSRWVKVDNSALIVIPPLLSVMDVI